VLKLNTRNMQKVSLPTYVGYWNAKILWLKQTIGFKSTEHKNIKIITSKRLNL
jgi:hypothetical protein